MYSGEQTGTWATIHDLYDRYGQEFVDKLAIRRKWDPSIEAYVADESRESICKVLSIALSDAKALIQKKLACRFSGINLLDEKFFPAIKIWHVRLTVETLKTGGDCLACACNVEMEKDFDCGSICSEDGVCLTSKKTFISVSTPKFECECMGVCKCC